MKSHRNHQSSYTRPKFRTLMAEFATKLSLNSKKQKGENHADEDMKDRLSELPEEVLLLILSLLTMEDAAKTSVLSRRWKMLWTSRNLNFDGSNIVDKYPHAIWNTNRKWKDIIALETLKFVNRVNGVMKSYQQAATNAIDELTIRFDLNETYRADIDGWVSFALEKKVKKFELDFTYRCWAHGNNYPFPQLNNTALGFPRSDSLTSLTLKRIDVAGEVLEFIISNSPFLERLCVVRSKSLVHLNVAGPALCLKYLEISHCDSMKRLQLSLTDLVSFKYFGRNISISSEVNVPNLVELWIELSHLRDFVYGNFPLPSAYISRIQKLILDAYVVTWEGLKEMKNIQFPCLSHLKELELRVTGGDYASLLGFSSLINASPSLSKLTLKFNWTYFDINSRREAKKAPIIPHSCLKVVEMVGFVGNTYDTEFCMYLIENAIMLEKITIDPRIPTLSLPSGCSRGKSTEVDIAKRIKAARERAEQLKTKYFLKDKLVIL